MNDCITIKQRLIWILLALCRSIVVDIVVDAVTNWLEWWFICSSLWTKDRRNVGDMSSVGNNVVTVSGWIHSVSSTCQANSPNMSAACLVSLSCLHFQPTWHSRHLQLRHEEMLKTTLLDQDEHEISMQRLSRCDKLVRVLISWVEYWIETKERSGTIPHTLKGVQYLFLFLSYQNLLPFSPY